MSSSATTTVTTAPTTSSSNGNGNTNSNDPADVIQVGLQGEDTLTKKLAYVQKQLITKEDVRFVLWSIPFIQPFRLVCLTLSLSLSLSLSHSPSFPSPIMCTRSWPVCV
jgi:hypothetical protein